VVLALATVAFGACDTSDIVSTDFLHVDAQVFALDGVTPVSNLPLDTYRWVVTYKDGSTVSLPFDQPLATDGRGRFSFSSGQLSLQSGNPVLRGCTDVCVGYQTRYEQFCTYEAVTENQYCSWWYVDEYGYDQCGEWVTESTTECVAWESRPVSYCTTWAEDCDYDYPERHVDDIALTRSEIDFRVGANQVTSFSVQNTGGSYVDLDSRKDRNTLQWLESPVFVTSLPPTSGQVSSGLTAALSPGQEALVAERNRSVKPRYRKTAKVYPREQARAGHFRSEELERLSHAQKRELEKARRAFEQAVGAGRD
jgi:hypothetical protein